MKTVSLLLLVSLASSCLAGVFSPITYPNTSNTSNTCAGTRIPLYFGLLMSFDAEQFDGSGAIAGVNVALDRINRNCTLLPGYSLHYTVANSRCTRTGGLDALFEDTIFSPGRDKIAVIGSGCSLATEPTAEVSHYYNISHLSCVSSSPDLTNRNRFRNYFQLLNSEVTIAHAYFAVIQEYGWSHVSLIVQNENLFTETIDILKQLLRAGDISYDERLFSSEGGVADLGDEPFNMDRRIHLIMCYASHARQLMCEAHSRDVYLPRHVLLTPAWYDANWWRVNDNTTCTPDDMETVLINSLAFLHFNFLDRNDTSNITSEDGLTATKYLKRENEQIGILPLNLTSSDYAQYCYDATWTLLYALQNTLEDIADNSINGNLSEAYGLPSGETFTLSNFTYDNNALSRIIFRHLNNTSFNGITGKVQFSSEGIREVTKLFIFQFRKNSSGFVNWVEIGEVTNNDTDYILTGEGVDTVWPNGIPYDGIPLNATATVHPAVTSVYFLLATAGIAFAVVCIVFNFVFRKRKLIRLTSPNLNLLIGIGAIILYFNLYLFIFPVQDPIVVSVLCNLIPWFTAIGYSLCYGTIVVKMTRVYYIFNNPTPKKAKVKDWKLFLGVFALVVIDVVILTVYMIVERSNIYPDGMTGLHACRVISREFPEQTEGEIIRFFIYVCRTQARDIMLGVLYGYKALLQVIALIFSFSIRKVKVKGLDDAIFIAGSIYVSSIVLAVIFVCTYTLADFLNIFPVVFCTGFLIGTSVILGLVFIPLMVGLYKDPEGDTIFDNSKSTAGGTTVMNNNLQTRTIEGLKGRVTELEAIVASTGGGFAHSLNRQYSVIEVESSTSIPTQAPVMTHDERREDMLHQIAGEAPRERTNTIWDNEDSGEEKEKKTSDNSSV